MSLDRTYNINSPQASIEITPLVLIESTQEHLTSHVSTVLRANQLLRIKHILYM